MSNDTIYRQMAIDAILGQPPEAHYPGWYAEQIKQLSPAQQWIPSKNLKPKDGEEVFVYLFGDSPYIAWIIDGRWYTEDFELDEEDYPDAWMPLPAKYHPEGEGHETK